MNDFNDLQNDWKSVSSNELQRKVQSDSLFGKLKKIQLKIVFGNLLMSISFAIVFAVFIWLWNENPLKERSDNFYLGLTFMFILLSVTLAMMWYRVLFWRTPNDISENMKAFATKMLKKLRYFKWITNFFMPVYLVLLAVGMTIYFQDVLREASLQFKLIAYGMTYAWLLIVGFIIVRKKQQKNNKDVDPIIESLEEVLANFK
jgi:cytochrome bd-type quinol oxidase subunit 1